MSKPVKDLPCFAQQVGGAHYKAMGEAQPWMVAAHRYSDDELRGAMMLTVDGYLSRRKGESHLQDVAKAQHTLAIYLDIMRNRKGGRVNG